MSDFIVRAKSLRVRVLPGSILALLAVVGCAVTDAEYGEKAEMLITTTATFQDAQLPTTSYAGTRDTMLESSSPSTNNGTDTSLSVEGDSGKNSLLSWDLSANIPTSAVVESATITLVVSDKSEETFSLFESKRAWDEAKATWKIYKSSTNWQTAGGLGSDDRGTTSLGSFAAPANGTYTITLNAAGVALVQRWVSSPSSNLGLFLDGPTTTNRLEFRSSEYSTKGSRPKLTVVWNDGGGATGTGGSTSTGGTTGSGGTSTGGTTGSGGTSTGGTTGTGGSAEVSLPTTPGNYKGTCDGSLGVALDANYFVDGNDENQGFRVYQRGQNATAAKTIDVSSQASMSSGDEGDFEDAARIGNRIYVISSHGRDKNGNLERQRYRLLGLDVAGAAPNVTLTAAGNTSTLLDKLLVSANWVTPNSSVISALNTASQLGTSTVASLAPKENGTNIEGLTWLPTASRPNQLLFGLRNPLSNSKAIVVSLLNADAVLSGATPSFGEAMLLDLGGLGIRGMAWSPLHQAVLLLGGPKDAGGPVRLYKWSGLAADLPVAIADLTAPADSAAEAIVVYPNTRDVQVLFDQGDHDVSGSPCKDASSSSRYFSDVIVHVP